MMPENLKKKMQELHYKWATSKAKDNLNRDASEYELKTLGIIPWIDGASAMFEELAPILSAKNERIRALEEVLRWIDRDIKFHPSEDPINKKINEALERTVRK